MKHLLILFSLLGTLQHLVAQTVSRQALSTMGGSYQGSSFQATWTVGETIISTFRYVFFQILLNRIARNTSLLYYQQFTSALKIQL